MYFQILVYLIIFPIVFGQCRFPGGSQADEFNRRLGQISKKKYRTLSNNTEYVVGICRAVVNGTVGVLQRAKHNISLGSIDNATFFSGDNWAYLEYENGNSHISKTCNDGNKRSIIMLICEKNEPEGLLKFLREVRENTHRCYYLFELKHKSLCSLKRFSIGLIIVITLFSVVIMYLFFGFLYKRCIVGAQGWEQVPNYEFWTDFGNLQADGCNYVCRRKQSANNYYRGIGDEQLDKNDDLERDDHLLPM